MMQTECLLEADLHRSKLNIEVRFLQLVERSIGKFPKPLQELHTSRDPVLSQ